MNKGLEIAVLVLLYFDAVGAIACLECKHVAEDNSCLVPERHCHSPSLNFCYTRLTTQEHAPPVVDRGCSFLCHSIKRPKNNYQESLLCCVKDLCNTHNLWTKD